ncbi:gastric triacylglycerol lipase-like isoform X3 [Varroa destructor]|uniref:Lipase n=1 Tax=Varroa destructor TaxID=109461 RepID=A0A7M7JCQ0_VARDE|nr:gastric triacylglycerol lipase-like isoform X3 [Varroa destructor]
MIRVSLLVFVILTPDNMTRSGSLKLLNTVRDVTKTVSNQLKSTIDKTVDRLSEVTSQDPDVSSILKGPGEYVRSYGYDYHEFNVTTKDGVILSVFRVSSGFDFIANPPHQGPGFFLANMGYDVYLPNTRGNKFSSCSESTHKHFYYSSFMEMAEYDLPAIIDAILSRTGFTKLHIIGHSRGTTVTFAMLASKPEYNKKIRLFTALAPVVYPDLSPAWSILQSIMHELKGVMDCIGYSRNRIFDSSKVNDLSFGLMNPLVCSIGGGVLCSAMLNVGMNPKLLRNVEHPRLNSSRARVYAVNTPAGSTVQDFVHFFQVIQTEKFAKFDYDDKPACYPVDKTNQIVYGQSTPPEYKLENINVPLVVFHSKDDTFAGPDGVAKLRQKVGKLVVNGGWYYIEKSKWLHLDYLWAMDAVQLVYLNVLRHLRESDKLEDGHVRDLDELFALYQTDTKNYISLI